MQALAVWVHARIGLEGMGEGISGGAWVQAAPKNVTHPLPHLGWLGAWVGWVGAVPGM